MNILKKYKLSIMVAVVVIVSIMFVCIMFSIAPDTFPKHIVVSIPKGMYLSQAARILHTDGIIKSEFIFKVYAVLTSGHRQIQSGDYLFDKPESALRIAYRTTHGVQNLPKISVTLYEGMTVKDMGIQIKKNIPDFDNITFYNIAKSSEGYLFPDTYFFYENVTPQQVLDLLTSNFDRKIKSISVELKSFGKSISDIVTMASLVEREATSSLDRRLIAGVLWNRISIDMPLQVDPPFYYLFGKGSLELTLKDLATDSPYNLYKHRGLTPTPINNPGLSAILDTVNPTKSNYLFFLSDSHGVMHYAATNDGHVANKIKYLQ